MLYIDIYFIINWVMNVLVILMAGVWRGSRPAAWRYGLAGAIGALWAVLPFITDWSEWLFSPVAAIGVGAIMCRIAWQCKGWKQTASAAVVLYTVTWLTGGCLNALYYQTRAGSFFRRLLYGGSDTVTALWLLLMAALVYLCFMAASWWYRHISSKESLLYPVELCYQGQKIELTALLDTGNHLYTLTGKPVSITELEILEQLAPQLADMVKGYFEGTTMQTDSIMMLVPFQSIGKEHEMMPVVWIDTMTLKRYTGDKTVVKAAVGISRTSFSKGKDYQMILHQSFGHRV